MTSSVISHNTSFGVLTVPYGEPMAPLRLQCPAGPHYLLSSDAFPEPSCPTCGFVLRESNGIMRALAPGRELYFRHFIDDYQTVRANEGRGSSTTDYYLALPFEDKTRHNSWQWRIRSRTYRHLERNLLPTVEAAYPGGFDFLDVGAGNCWLSYRLALRGHRAVAVDLLDNDTDGLGAGRHYLPSVATQLLRFQAEMDRLPFASEQFDVVVFNASFHYSVDYLRTMGEAIRCLRRPGY